MKRVCKFLSLALALWIAAPASFAADTTARDEASSTVVVTEGSGAKAVTREQPADGAAAAKGAPENDTSVTVVQTPKGKTSVVTAGATDLLERFVNWLHGFFPEIEDRLFHLIACTVIILLAIVLRTVITNIIFYSLKKLASRTETTLDDKLFPALERPTATLVMVLGIFAALTILEVAPSTDVLIGNAAKITILGVIIWGMIRAGAAVLDHGEEIARKRQLTVATFMPLIKKSLLVFAVILGVLIIADSVGAPVRVFLTSLGIGGLAFALAAQDTIANLFGSFVVVVDQPFRVGDTVKVGAFTGTVEDIGLRSTKLRLVDKSIVVIPNKSMASESITNLARFTQRRVEQVIGLTYDTKPEQMAEIVDEFKRLILAEQEVDPTSVLVYFRDYSASSLDIWLVYVAQSPDFQASMQLRQRLNLAMMRAVTSRGLSFAFPTQTIHLDGPVAKQLAAGDTPPRG